MKNFRITYFFLLCIAGAYLAPMHAQESCYEQYLREHNKKILTDEDADDSYDELKKTVLARQMYGDSYLLKADTIAQRAMITKVDGTYVADVHVALVDSTWYMWLSVDPLADKYPGNTPYMYCNGNPIMLVDLYGEEPVTPAPIELYGTPEYYKFRQEDYAKRHPGETHFYYEPYGVANCTKFLSEETMSKLSPEGQVWDKQVAYNLASLLEEQLKQMGDNASQFEEDQESFDLFVYPSHEDAYKNKGQQELRDLPLSDLLVIVRTPSLKHMFGNKHSITSMCKITGYLLNESNAPFFFVLRGINQDSMLHPHPDIPYLIPNER